jgi:putative PIN family toxin of toxin-antitoxin system
MILAVFDTNIIISAGITPGGVPAKLIFEWVMKKRIQVVTSPEVVAEYRYVARRPRFRRYKFPPLWLEVLIEESLALQNPEPCMQPCPDPSDLPFLALAHTAGAWLVTGNLKHFPESMRNGVNVLSPADYLAHLVGDEQAPK